MSIAPAEERILPDQGVEDASIGADH